jgi:hypothetical protein
MKETCDSMTDLPKCYDDCAFYYEHDYGQCLILYHFLLKDFTYENFPASKECKYYRNICELEKYLGINHD